MIKKDYIDIIEALLFASPDPLTQKKVNMVLSSESPELKIIVDELNQNYIDAGNAFEIRFIANGYQLVAKKEYEHYINMMLSKTGKVNLSPAALDSLAIIAYKQPISRHEIEAIRGVDSSGVIKTLLSRKLVAIKGRSNGPGRPLLYKTTDGFLQYFGLKTISDLPKLKEITELLDSDPRLGEQIAVFDKNNKIEKTANENK